MMKHFLLIILMLLTLGIASAEENIVKVSNPVEVNSELKYAGQIPKDIEGLQWNRWTSRNFTVCSLNDAQAQYLHKHLEFVKVWAFVRWGLTDTDFSVECKVICVDRPELFKKLFKLDATKVEVRRDALGKIKEHVIFLLCDDQPSRVIPMPLAEICLAELAQKHNLKIGHWAVRGMSMLNASIGQIRQRIAEVGLILQRNDPLFFSKGLLEMDQDQYHALPDDKKRVYDNCAMLFCLMLRKEFGQDNYLAFLKNASTMSPELALQKTVFFKNYDHFDRSFKRYMADLTNNVASGTTPDNYLQIKEKH